MIRVSSDSRGLCLRAVDQLGSAVLDQPLFRMFLRAQIKGALQADGSWLVLWQEEKPPIVERVALHFDRYGIAYELDDATRRLLRQLQDSRDQFESILQAGLSTKARLTQVDRHRILHLLRKSFARSLTPAQLHAVAHVCSVHHGANFSVPGSGKTSVALAYFEILRQLREVEVLVVVGPVACFQPWEDEFRACFGRLPRSVRLAGRSKGEREEVYLLGDEYELFLISYHTMAKDVEGLRALLTKHRSLLVLDESHYIKRPVGGVLAESVLSLAQHAVRRLILTGTPMPNGPQDLWSQVTFLWPQRRPLGTIEAYLSEIARLDAQRVVRSVRKRIEPLFFTTTKRELGLPSPCFRIVFCRLRPLQARIYAGVAARFLSQVAEAPHDRETLRTWRAARAVRLLQIAVNPTLLRKSQDDFGLPPLDVGNANLRAVIDHYPLYEKPAKFDEAVRLVSRLCLAGKKVILWSSFIHNLTMLKKELSRFDPVVICGQVPYAAPDDAETTREQLLLRFREEPACQVLIANPAACAESVSLHSVCHDAVYLDRTFNCAHYLQSLDRIHRLGLARGTSTTYYILIAAGTIDDVVHRRLAQKARNMRAVIEGGVLARLDGYWGADIGGEDDRDLECVEDHIRDAAAGRNG